MTHKTFSSFFYPCFTPALSLLYSCFTPAFSVLYPCPPCHYSLQSRLFRVRRIRDSSEELRDFPNIPEIHPRSLCRRLQQMDKEMWNWNKRYFQFFFVFIYPSRRFLIFRHFFHLSIFFVVITLHVSYPTTASFFCCILYVTILYYILSFFFQN